MATQLQSSTAELTWEETGAPRGVWSPQDTQLAAADYPHARSNKSWHNYHLQKYRNWVKVSFSSSAGACLVSTQPVYQRAVLYICCAGSHSTFLSPAKAQKHQIDELKPLGEAGVHLLCVTSLQLSEQRRRSPVCFPTAVVKLLRESETSLTNHICLINKAACNKAGISGSGNMQEIT